MNKQGKRAAAAALGLALGFGLVALPECLAEVGSYRSPYSVEFSYPLAELHGPDAVPPRDDPHKESSTPHERWYSREIRQKYGAWGPEPRHYPAIDHLHELPPAWKRQRVLAVATSFIGLPYQHHHIPDWNPPPDWPWKQVAYGRNSKGVDCSDFTSWCYNYGLGIKLNTSVTKQAAHDDVPGAGGNGTIRVRVIHDDEGYDALVTKLKTADLLYIMPDGSDKISHVIMWVGVHGRSPDGTPLIIDCTGSGHKDANGNDIPIGVNLRPFTRDSWYYKRFAHAHRIIHEE